MPLSLEQGECKSFDGAVLRYRAWLPEGGTTRGVVLFHRGHEHSGRWEETVRGLDLEQVAYFAWDQRGHGDSAGERGDAESVAAVAKDADVFVRHISARYGVAIQDMAVVAHSVGAVVAAAWIHDYAPPIRGMVLAAPALRVRLYVPLAIPALRMKQRMLGNSYVKSYVKAHMLTHDPEQAAAYAADKGIFRQISVRMLLDLHDTSTRLLADAGAMTAPALILAAGKDWVVQNKAQEYFYEHLGSTIKQYELFPGFYHGMFHEKGRAALIARIRPFLADCLGRCPNRGGLADGDLGGYTRTEFDRLRLPGSMRWGIARAFLKTFGMLSDGIKLGQKEGFDSGVMLDYVYKNKARGITPLGKIIDYFYLNSIGWRGIRVRRAHLEAMLRRVMEETHAAGRPVRIVDIAAGAGRYVLETMQAVPGIAASAVLRDYKEANLAAARALAEAMKIPNVTVEHGDAFDRHSLAAISPRPTIAIASGLFELFPENGPLRQSLAGLADAAEPGGHLIYTCQPWHPQVEFIARVLTNREGKPWIMRRRTQGEMDELVRQAGFEKIDQAIDRWGIFTVSLARRTEKRV